MPFPSGSLLSREPAGLGHWRRQLTLVSGGRSTTRSLSAGAAPNAAEEAVASYGRSRGDAADRNHSGAPKQIVLERRGCAQRLQKTWRQYLIVSLRPDRAGWGFARATLFSAYHFLEKVRLRWLVPGDDSRSPPVRTEVPACRGPGNARVRIPGSAFPVRRQPDKDRLRMMALPMRSAGNQGPHRPGGEESPELRTPGSEQG